MLVKLDGKDTETVINALIDNTRNLPQELYKSLTWPATSDLRWRLTFCRTHSATSESRNTRVLACRLPHQIRGRSTTRQDRHSPDRPHTPTLPRARPGLLSPG